MAGDVRFEKQQLHELIDRFLPSAVARFCAP